MGITPHTSCQNSAVAFDKELLFKQKPRERSFEVVPGLYQTLSYVWASSLSLAFQPLLPSPLPFFHGNTQTNRKQLLPGKQPEGLQRASEILYLRLSLGIGRLTHRMTDKLWQLCCFFLHISLHPHTSSSSLIPLSPRCHLSSTSVFSLGIKSTALKAAGCRVRYMLTVPAARKMHKQLGNKGIYKPLHRTMQTIPSCKELLSLSSNKVTRVVVPDSRDAPGPPASRRELLVSLHASAAYANQSAQTRKWRRPVRLFQSPLSDCGSVSVFPLTDLGDHTAVGPPQRGCRTTTEKEELSRVEGLRGGTEHQPHTERHPDNTSALSAGPHRYCKLSQIKVVGSKLSLGVSRLIFIFVTRMDESQVKTQHCAVGPVTYQGAFLRRPFDQDLQKENWSLPPLLCLTIN
ncbi:hypothetical protein Q8A73_016709 [Channa argus]|nr:hypothetical protein Q8A73_016709 [Channa argus]